MTAWARLLQPARAMWVTLRRLRSSPQQHGGTLPFRGLPAARADHDGRLICDECGVCADLCPTRCIRVGRSGGQVEIDIDWRRCITCGICVSECPVQALELDAGTTRWFMAQTIDRDGPQVQLPDVGEG